MQAEQTSPRRGFTTSSLVWLGVVTTLSVVVLLAAFSNKAAVSNRAAVPTTAPAAASAPAAKSTTPARGEQGHIKGGAAALGTTQENYSKLSTAILHNDEYGKSEMLVRGTVFVVLDSTPVLVLDRGGLLASMVQVRVLEGAHAGKAGWLPYEYVGK